MISTRRERSLRIRRLRADVPLLASCSDRQLQAIDNLGVQADLRAGATLTTQGSLGREIFFVLEGSAVARSCDVTIGDIHAGSVAGEMALLEAGARTATVTARSPMRLLVLDQHEFGELLALEPAIEDRLRGIAEERRVELGAAGVG